MKSGICMRFDFSDMPIRNRAFGEKPMTFCDPEPKNFLSAILDVAAIETGHPPAREHWQTAQLRNLIKHATERSTFWQQRIGTPKLSGVSLSALPILERGAVMKQVVDEGSLLRPGDQIAVNTSSTSGSSGVPVKFFASGMNARYNHVRSVAQYLLEGRDLTLNRVQVDYTPHLAKEGLKVTRSEAWLGALSSFFGCGANKVIEYFRPDMKQFREELERDAIGYLVTAQWTVDTLLQSIDLFALKRAGLHMWISVADAVDPALREALKSQGVAVRSTYSAQEVGPIGFECEHVPGNYHVATSNVIVEVDSGQSYRLGPHRLGRVLVTHLHSYATPFIRYDIGDLASLAPACLCGRPGPTLSNVYGRGKNLLKHRDGTVSPFYLGTSLIAKLPEFKDYRIRQTDIATIVIEIGGRADLNPNEQNTIIDLIRKQAGDEFRVEVKVVPEIDWRGSVKKLGFYNEVL
jgi:phenylacetate-coenzyme A ligase PaaK-like adenylate-forming protein